MILNYKGTNGSYISTCTYEAGKEEEKLIHFQPRHSNAIIIAYFYMLSRVEKLNAWSCGKYITVVNLIINSLVHPR
jgi:hypothetical protein